MKTSRLELANDRASDRAIARVVGEGLFKRKSVVNRATRARHSDDPFVIRRAVRYELLEALRSPRNTSAARPG